MGHRLPGHAVLGEGLGLVSNDHGATWSSIDVDRQLPSVRRAARATGVSTVHVLRHGRLVVANNKGTWVADDAANKTFHEVAGTAPIRRFDVKGSAGSVLHGLLVREEETTTSISADGGIAWQPLTPKLAQDLAGSR